MTQRRIGITLRRLPASGQSAARDALDSDWLDWFADELAECQPVLLPNFSRPEQLSTYVRELAINALVLSGGDDIGSSTPRDRNELQLLQLAASQGWPVLGVCRGMQLLHVQDGGSLVAGSDRPGQPHRIQFAGGCCMVNSWHRWCIRNPGADWQALARADDGHVEAMQHVRLPWLGLMWHPEREHGARALCRRWWLPLLHCAPEVSE